MAKIVLKDIEKWKELNKGNNFSLYDYIFHIMKSKEINSDIYFAFAELFWPSFIVYENHVFLKENFSQEKFSELAKSKNKIEFWMNFLTIDPYFENNEEGIKKAISLIHILVKIWHLKLKEDFPALEFKVEYLYDTEEGDYGLTFYQLKK